MMPYKSKLLDENGQLIPASDLPRSARRGSTHNAGNGRQRRRSTRYYLAKAEDYLTAVDRGMISAADGARRVGMVKDCAGIFLVHQELELRGQGAPADVTPTPDEEYTPPQIQAYRKKKVTVKEGVNQHGLPISEKSVSIESHASDDSEPSAEIEAIT